MKSFASDSLHQIIERAACQMAAAYQTVAAHYVIKEIADDMPPKITIVRYGMPSETAAAHDMGSKIAGAVAAGAVAAVAAVAAGAVAAQSGTTSKCGGIVGWLTFANESNATKAAILGTGPFIGPWKSDQATRAIGAVGGPGGSVVEIACLVVGTMVKTPLLIPGTLMMI